MILVVIAQDSESWEMVTERPTLGHVFLQSLKRDEAYDSLCA